MVVIIHQCQHDSLFEAIEFHWRRMVFKLTAGLANNDWNVMAHSLKHFYHFIRGLWRTLFWHKPLLVGGC